MAAGHAVATCPESPVIRLGSIRSGAPSKHARDWGLKHSLCMRSRWRTGNARDMKSKLCGGFFGSTLRRELPKMMENNIRLFAIGRLNALPVQVRDELSAAVDETSGNTGLCVNLAINYGGRAEIVDAVNAIIDKARHSRELVIDEQMLASHLYTAHVSDPDLLIRTSGEMRVSNFLLWQIAYAELYVTETLWPDFKRTDLLRAVLDYQKRDRRFGGVTAEPACLSAGDAGHCHARPMKRVLTALILLPFAIFGIFFAPPPVFLALVVLMAALCYYEYAAIASAHWIGYAIGLLVLFDLPYAPGLAVAVLTIGITVRELGKVLPVAAATALGVLYIFVGWRCAVDLRAAGVHWLLFALAVNWVGDVAAFYVGRSLGKHKLAPRISPGKSWEGTAGSMLAAVVFGYAFFRYVQPSIPLMHMLALAAVANIAGQVGDLAESALKRGAGVKDSSTLLPGHGGFLDRLDSSLFTMPVVYYYLKYVSR